MNLQGQVALVTGASRGIGRACALALAESGAAVVVNYVTNRDLAESAVAEIQARGGQAIAWQADVADGAACEQMVTAAAERFGRLDILVNNAGTGLEKLVLDTTDADVDRLIAIHLRGMFACSRAALRPMMRQRYGRIINMSSIWGVQGAGGEVAYSMVKAGQIGFTQGLAQEVGPMGITVNAVAPGAVQTDMIADLVGGALDDWLAKTPVGRLGTPVEIAKVVNFLASPDAGFITGQVWSPNGGAVL